MTFFKEKIKRVKEIVEKKDLSYSVSISVRLHDAENHAVSKAYLNKI
jgi:hypothetical protein